MELRTEITWSFLIDAENAFYKIQHSFMLKAPKKLRTKRIYLTIMKAIYDKHSEHYAKLGETRSIPNKMRNKTRMFTFTTRIQYSAGIPS